MRRLAAGLEALIWPSGVACLRCGERSFGRLLCQACQEALDGIPARLRPDGIHAVWEYTGVARDLVIALKHDGLADCAQVLAEGVASRLQRMTIPPDALLTWVTMPDERLQERGIDHARLLCEAVARRTGYPCRRTMKRIGNGHTQQGLSARERLNNLRGSIEGDVSLSGTVVLIDDVATTGATALACRHALHKCGAEHVLAITATSSGVPK